MELIAETNKKASRQIGCLLCGTIKEPLQLHKKRKSKHQNKLFTFTCQVCKWNNKHYSAAVILYFIRHLSRSVQCIGWFVDSWKQKIMQKLLKWGITGHMHSKEQRRFTCKGFSRFLGATWNLPWKLNIPTFLWVVYISCLLIHI